MATALFTVRDLACATEKGSQIFSGADLSLKEGDVVVLQGKSGSGKTTFLKCLAHLNLYTGDILFYGNHPDGETAPTTGVPVFRTKVAYVPQRPPLLPGSPREFLATICSFKARKNTRDTSKSAAPGLTAASEASHDAIDIASSWGIEPQLWDREWNNLSGGETQRIAIAIAVGLNTAEVLLLDEPTSALDQESSLLVERYILDRLRSSESPLKSIIWITHSPEQAGRVGTRFLEFADGTCSEVFNAPV